MILLRLFYEFAKTGLFAVGGGLATLPFLYAMSEKTGWFTYQDVADMIAVSESTPGAMGVNMSTYVGFTTAGVPGAVLGSLGLIFPSIVIIIVISKVLQKFKDSRMVQDAFYGLRPASTGLIASAGLGVAGTALLNLEVYAAGGDLGQILRVPPILLAAAVFLAMRRWKLHPAAYIGIAAAAGILFQL